MIKPIKVFVPVSVETPPETSGYYAVIQKGWTGVRQLHFNKKKGEFWDKHSAQTNVKTWLKEETKICLSVQELYALFQDYYTNRDKYNSLNEYISSLNIK